MYKTAIIGLGQIGYKIDDDPFRTIIWSHSKTYIKHNNTKLIAVCDIDKAKYNDFNEYYPNIEFYDDYVRMIKNVDLDILSICSPTNTHLSIVRDAIILNPPKAIFIEKPMGIDLEEASNISEMCNKNNIILAVNYMRRWDNKYQVLNEIIKSNKLGKLQSITAYGCTALLTSTSHLLDLFVYFGGAIEWVVGDLQNDYVREVNQTKDPGGIAFVKFMNGAYGFLKGISKSQFYYMFEIDLLFSDGRVTVSDDGREINVYTFLKNDTCSVVEYKMLKKDLSYNIVSENERMLDAISNIIECIETRQKPKSNELNSKEVHRLIQCIKLSDKNNNTKILYKDINV